MTFRKATLDDWPILLSWRNDQLTRANSRNGEIISEEDHRRWLRSVIDNPNRELFIVEDIGTMRADRNGESYELSWTVAPEKRGVGNGKRMLLSFLQIFHHPVTAEIKRENIASIKIAEAAGLVLDNEQNGMLHFSGIGKSCTMHSLNMDVTE